jgi:hypothetical protein
MDSIYEIIRPKSPLPITLFNLFAVLERKNVLSGSNSVHASYGDRTSQFPFTP